MKRVIDSLAGIATHIGYVLLIAGIAYVLALLFIPFANAGELKPVSSDELIGNASKFNGKRVLFQGEAIGDFMVRGDYGWINVKDESNAIGVWTKKNFKKQLKFIGSYREKGDTVKVEGIFNKACKVHGGDTDIHAINISAIKQGRETVHKVSVSRVRAAALLTAAALLALLFNIRRSQRYL